jgi:hypothetical protein
MVVELFFLSDYINYPPHIYMYRSWQGLDPQTFLGAQMTQFGKWLKGLSIKYSFYNKCDMISMYKNNA